ncbi:MAG: F0F1 ATP synthase subunit epsilon [Propionibacteriaceae bacterium]|nr:F0F1 ATP synthase subunit epsilon [Propionibacteriaceae bacterium]
MATAMQVEVVAPDGMVWEGEAVSVIVRTTEGDIGILSDHEPVMAAMVPCAAEVVSTDGRRQIIAVGGGFISVYHNRVSLLSDTASLAGQISLIEAERALASMKDQMEQGELSGREARRYRQLEAQVIAGHRYQQLRGNLSGAAPVS